MLYIETMKSNRRSIFDSSNLRLFYRLAEMTSQLSLKTTTAEF